MVPPRKRGGVPNGNAPVLPHIDDPGSRAKSQRRGDSGRAVGHPMGYSRIRSGGQKGPKGERSEALNDAPVGPMSLGIHHYCVVVPDIEEAVRWYEDKLDFELERAFGFPEVGTQIAHITNVNGVRIELIARDGSAAGPDVGQDPFGALLVQGSKHIGFLVDDMQATARELRRRGVEFVMEPNTAPPAGVINCWIRDPAGTLIEFDQWLPQELS